MTLFDRSGRRSRFTSKGRALLESGRPLLARADAFDEEVQHLATGWEPRLIISVDQVMRIGPLMPIAAEFFAVAPRTSLQIRREAAAGSWDALMSGRADLIVGAPAGGHSGGGFESAAFGARQFVLAVASNHPLASRREKIGLEEISKVRAIVLGDTTRNLPHLPYGLQDNTMSLSVPDPATKLEAILLGLGCGFLLKKVAEPLVSEGRLAVLDVDMPHPPGESRIAWRSGETGRALKWWIDRLTDPSFAETLFS